MIGRGRDIVHVPENASCTSARVLMVHGDSWTGGSPNETGYFTSGSRLASMTGAVVMAIDYPLAPTCLDYPTCSKKANFTSIVDWILRSAEYLATTLPAVEGSSLPAEGCQNEAGSGPPMLIFGDSSGAASAFSALLTLSSQSDSLNGGKDAFAGGILWSGFYNLQCDTPTYISNAFADVPKMSDRDEHSDWLVGDVLFTSAPAQEAWSSYLLSLNYAGSVEATKNPLANTVSASREALQGLPPLYMTVGGAEVLMGENLLMAEVAAAADHTNEVIIDVFDGMFHVFEMYSEGCGNEKKEPLWQANLAWARSARFVKDVHATTHAPCFSQNPKGAPLTTWHVTMPGSQDKDWAPLGNGPDGFLC
jgi:acetyl esterase/lipase